MLTEKHWETATSGYIAKMNSAYQRHRLEVIRELLPPLQDKVVLDFGCGEGVLMREASERGAKHIIGIDSNAEMLDKARFFQVFQGGVALLENFHSVDCLIAANVLAYLSEEEEALFYRQAYQIVRPKGYLVVTHSNALFDMFTLNSRTADFFFTHFAFDSSALLTNPNKPKRPTFSIRENPLSYRYKLARHGFREERQEFMNFHSLPPLLSGDDPDDLDRERLNTLDWPEDQRWKLAFQCSMFGVRAQRL